MNDVILFLIELADFFNIYTILANSVSRLDRDGCKRINVTAAKTDPSLQLQMITDIKCNDEMIKHLMKCMQLFRPSVSEAIQMKYDAVGLWSLKESRQTHR